MKDGYGHHQACKGICVCVDVEGGRNRWKKDRGCWKNTWKAGLAS